MEQLPNVILRGGPAQHGEHYFYAEEHVSEKLKVFRGHRHDHFERTIETCVHDGRHLPVYSWIGCTYVAE